MLGLNIFSLKMKMDTSIGSAREIYIENHVNRIYLLLNTFY
jgi:hypothetical protein